jgi:hypothetical protein
MKFHRTITNIIRKLHPIIQQFKYANKLLPTHTMRNQYYTHVYPHLIGSIPVWGTHEDSKTYIQPLIRTQKKIIRLITNSKPRTHTGPIMQKLKILNITSLYIFRVCAEMHPYLYPRKQVNRPEHTHHYIYSSEIHEHNTRHANKQHLFIPNSLSHKYSNLKTPQYVMDHFTVLYSKIWNSIPFEIQTVQNLSKFKISLKQYLLQKQKK